MQHIVSGSSLRNPKMLLIAAEEVLRERICPHLRTIGFQIQVAATGEQAIAQARNLHPDVLVLQRHFPDSNSLEVCRHLRNDPLTSRLPILLVSEKDDIRDHILGLKAGADDFLTLTRHGGETSELLERIRALLAREARIVDQKIKIVD